jgi:hypothetical protein
MKTKALLTAGLLMAAGAVSSFAQTVYSVNAVGFVNLTFAPGFSLNSNPLDNGGSNTVAALFPTGSVPIGTAIYTFDPVSGNYVVASYGRGGWTSGGGNVLNPGVGFFFKNPTLQPLTNTFVGNVMQGTLNTPLSAGFNLVGSQVPQTGLVSTDLQLPVGVGDTIFQFDPVNQVYVPSTQARGGAWNPSEPTVAVGEGFFVKKQSAIVWTRTFSVNQ